MPAIEPARIDPLRVPSALGRATPRWRSLRTTWGLAGVLLALGAFVVWGDLTTARAAGTQSEALAVASLFEEAQYSVAVQGLYARQYELQPSSAVFRRYQDADSDAVSALVKAQQSGDREARHRATALLALHQTYRQAAAKMIDAVAGGAANISLIENLEVSPAFFSLQEQVNDTATAYRVQAQLRVNALRHLQEQLLTGTVIGLCVGLALLTMIWRTVLGYQRKLTVQADTNAHLALHDPLTGLPNRAFFAHQLVHARHELARAPSRSGAQPHGSAVMVLDLDRFKEVNDTYGHAAGDQLLVEVGRRLRAALGEQDLLARLGGDEFAVLLPRVRDVGDAREVAERVAAAVREPFTLDRAPLPVAVPASIGVAFTPESSGLEPLVRCADAAMYRAKASHQGVAVYDHEMDRDDPARLALFGQLRGLLEGGDPDGQLVLFYQPQVRLQDASLYGVEALVRWLHPQRGLLLPGTFLPLAEETGLEISLTYHLLRLAVGEAARWERAGWGIPVAVNVSPDCLLDPDFTNTVRGALAEAGLPAALLRLEVTEGSMMADPKRSGAVLSELKLTGVMASVDDFGSGYSSLGQLRRMPVGELKIDKSFVRDLAHDPDDEVLVRTAISLGHHHRAVVVAEGVEDNPTLEILARLGCDVAQGFLLSRPVPPDQVRGACREAKAVVRALASTIPATGGPAAEPRPPVPDPRHHR
jgi:diguanylate cyclase (GGDEF)-like protein